MDFKEAIATIIVPIGILLTVLGSLINIILTTRSLKKTKYVDVICSERIRWIGTIRDETSRLISELLILFRKIEWILDDVNQKPSNVNQKLIDNYNRVKNEVHQESIKVDLIRRIMLLKLKYSQYEDQEIIAAFNYINSILSKNIYNIADIKIAITKLDIITKRTQMSLLNEWAKVNNEVLASFRALKKHKKARAIEIARLADLVEIE